MRKRQIFEEKVSEHIIRNVTLAMKKRITTAQSQCAANGVFVSKIRQGLKVTTTLTRHRTVESKVVQRHSGPQPDSKKIRPSYLESARKLER